MSTYAAVNVQATSSILWIDDEVSVADAGVRLVVLAGFRVECAHSGAEGLRRAVARTHSAIILDLRLPDIDGLRVLELLVGVRIESPVLVLTGYGDNTTALAAMALGATRFRSKPLCGDELVDTITALTSFVGCRQAPRALDTAVRSQSENWA